MKDGDPAAGHRRDDNTSIEPIKLIDPITFDGHPVPPRQWLLQQWIPLGSTTALYGDGGVGKSLLGQQLLTSCATGALFLGLDVKRCRTLGVFCEDDGDELHRRQAAINAKLGVEWADLEDVRWIERVGADNLLMTFAADGHGKTTAFHDQLVAAAMEMGAQLIVIDTAADTFGGNENFRPQVRQFVAMLTRIAQTISGSVVLLAHPSVAGRDSGRGESGSTAWANSVRSRLYFRRADGEDADNDLRILSRPKSNYARAGDELTVGWDEGAFVRRDRGQGGDQFRSAGAEQAFLNGLGEVLNTGSRANHHRGNGNFAPKLILGMSTAAKAGGFSEQELSAAMYRLMKAGHIKPVQTGPRSQRRSTLEIVPGLDLSDNVVEFARPGGEAQD